MKRAISALCLMCVLLSIPANFACGNNTTTEGTTDNSDTTETTTEGVTTEQDIRSTLPIADFGGDEFNIFLWDLSQIAVTDETGDIINDAVYKRNSDVEEMYNVKLNFTVQDGSSGTGKAPLWFNTLN